MIHRLNTFTFRRSLYFFFNDTPTTKIYTLSLHDALPIFERNQRLAKNDAFEIGRRAQRRLTRDLPKYILGLDRKSTRLNSSHMSISYAVFCLKKKKKIIN